MEEPDDCRSNHCVVGAIIVAVIGLIVLFREKEPSDNAIANKIIERYEKTVGERDATIGTLQRSLEEKERELATIKAAVERVGREARPTATTTSS